jgi:hypothetical protein
MYASRELAQTLRYFAGDRFRMNQRRRHVASPRRDAARNAGLPFDEPPSYNNSAFGAANEGRS